MAYETERRTAIQAVVKACHLCESVRASLVEGEMITKQDRSPVTLADYGAQAVISLDLMRAFPEDPIVAEENTSELRSPAGRDLIRKIVQQVTAASTHLSEKDVLDAIDSGGHGGGHGGRYWTLDPVDGTKGFLRGGQYAVALALLEDGEAVLGLLGCPNLPLDPARPDGGRGCLFIGVKGEGSTMRSLDDPRESRIHVTGIRDPSLAVFCESVEASHSSHSQAARVTALLGVSAPPIRIDSQCKYAAVARGEASIYLRLPTRADYQEKIWDHSAGWIIVKEAGGQISDVHDHPLDFSCGRELRHNTGVVVTNGLLHAPVMVAVQQVLADSGVTTTTLHS